MNKKKSLEVRQEELRKAIGDLLKAKEQLFQLKYLNNDPNVTLSVEDRMLLKDLPIDITAHCRTINSLKHAIKKLEEEHGRISKEF